MFWARSLPLATIRIVKGKRRLCGALTTQNADIVMRSEGRSPARHTQCLHDIDARIDDELAGFCYLANDIDLVSFNFLDRYRINAGFNSHQDIANAPPF